MMAWIAFRGITCASTALRKRMNSWCRWRCILRPMTVPSGTLVGVGHRSGAARLYRQTGLGAVERLDLAFFIDREDYSMGGRIDIEADDVAQLVDKMRVGGELELLNPVRLKAVRTPNALDGTRADIDDLRHHGGGPVGQLGWG